MNFHDLSQALRRETLRRLAAGELTQGQIASLTGFRQAHISNFLNGRRALSLEGLDRLLRIQKLTAQDLVPPETAVASRAGVELRAAGRVAGRIPLLAASASLEDRRYPDTSEWLPLSPSDIRLRKLTVPPERRPWQRLVAIRVTGKSANGVTGRLPAGSIAVIDRHDTNHLRHGRGAANIFAVAFAGTPLRFCCIQEDTPLLLLHSELAGGPLRALPASAVQIAGRVCGAITHL